ncbi:MAG: GyrI-like domain-containing protein [Anaerofustis sp.]
MQVITEQIPPLRIVYIRRTGVYGIENTRTMEQLKIWAKANNLMDNQTVIFGIAQDNPRTVDAERCRYDACIAVSDDYVVHDDIIHQGMISGGRYAVFQVEHTERAVAQAWMEIFPELQKQQYQVDTTRPIMERYRAMLVNQHQCEICVPVE